MLKTEEISQEDYNRWRYRYPEFSNTPVSSFPMNHEKMLPNRCHRGGKAL